MKTLYILRHAKSSWTDPEMSDFDRPLNHRGEKAAPFMGELMSRKSLQPYLILASPALRAKQTAEIVKKTGKLDAELRFEHLIYEASPQTLRQIVSEIDNAYPTAMLVGHNPGLEGFVYFLTGILQPFPTAALAVVDLNIDSWSAVSEGCGIARQIFRPRDEMLLAGEAK